MAITIGKTKLGRLLASVSAVLALLKQLLPSSQKRVEFDCQCVDVDEVIGKYTCNKR